MSSFEHAPIELWAGVECTLNRVGDTFIDQLERTGHAARPEDLDRFAALGFKVLRFPILWERIMPDAGAQADWSWADRGLGRLRELGIAPIVGLLHHGSGPRYTSLVDPAFPDKFSAFARAVAERYPWVERYIPLNEPMTTARFSGLYGHWYPHARDDLTFARTLLIQCRALVLAMQAIRAVNPAAQLIQTDDLGHTASTPLLAYQADFENERRWMAFDLLCGRLTPEHPMWAYLRTTGIAEADLAWFLEHPCPADIIGMNYYTTSERFLDERMDLYPASSHGGNGRHKYADVEAVRVPCGMAGPFALLGRLWERYRRPIAITEVQLACTREEQLRWLVEMWDTATSLRRGGVDICAVTAWSLLGSYDWHNLVTSLEGRYESGVFDVRAPQPRPTALATFVRELAAGRKPDHPVLAVPGWWRRPVRLLYKEATVEPTGAAAERYSEPTSSDARSLPARPILLIGAQPLARAFARVCDLRGLAYKRVSGRKFDIRQPAAVEAMLEKLRPWAVVNAHEYAQVEAAERQPERCFRANADGPAALAVVCARRGVQFLTFSSNLVFDGFGRAPYVESDPTGPLNVYGQSKARAESLVLSALPSALIIRTSILFESCDPNNFLTAALRRIRTGRALALDDDAITSATYTPDLVHACLDLLIDHEQGIWHLANPGGLSIMALVRRAAEQIGIDSGRLERRAGPRTRAARYPSYSVLGSERADLLPPLEDALLRYAWEYERPPDG